MDAMVQTDYTAHLDAKNRLTIRGAKYAYYQVKEYTNGCILLEPRELVRPKEISQRTLKMMDEAVANLKQGKASAPLDLSEF
ncbi:hypothetical protein [Selenomonas bovis]|jgi:cytidylate kinase|uniref:hypothetical protein n=1 Tax=Selenomonas bovis TaxID=416586 RepID=UPI0004E14570|nr:hypothetical protein [Selenomonas bovis]